MTSQLHSIFLGFYGYNLLLSLQLLVIFALRKPLSRKLGSRYAYLAWLIPVFCIPFCFVNGNGILQTLTSLLPDNGARVSVTPVLGALHSPTLFDFSFALPNLTDTATSQTGLSLASVATLVWISGIAILTVKFCIEKIRLDRLLGKAMPVSSGTTTSKDLIDSGFPAATPVLTLAELNSPAFSGVKKPVLLLPEDFTQRFDSSERLAMLRHEHVHFSRKDNAWNLMAYLCKVLFWPNPLIHLAYRLFRQDQEISCDTAALAQCNEQERKRYALTLIGSLNESGIFQKQPLVSTWGAFHNIKERALMIQNHRTPTLPRQIAMTVLFLLAVILATLTTTLSVSAQQQSENPPTSEANIVSSEVSSLMMSFQNARGSENSAQAEAILEELHVMHEQGKLSTYESYIMFLFYGGRASEQERYAEAIAYYDQGLALTALGNPQKKQLYMAKAQAYRPMDELPQAINSFLQAHELSEEPDYSVLKGLMYSYYQLDDYPQALRYAEQFLEEKYDLANQGDYQMISGLYRSVGNDTRADALDREAEQRLQEPGFIAVELEERDLMPLTTVPPVYPASALAQKIEGWVHVGFTVDTNGEVLDPHVIDQDPERVFEQAALDAIVRFKFREKAAGSNRQYVFTFRTDN